jgi:hypothetical protein
MGKKEVERQWRAGKYIAILGKRNGVAFLMVEREEGGDPLVIIHGEGAGVTLSPRYLPTPRILEKIREVKDLYQGARDFGNPCPSIDIETIVDFLTAFGFKDQADQIRSAHREDEEREVQKMRDSLRED